MLVAKKLKQCEYQMRWGSMQLVVFPYMMMYTIFKFPVYSTTSQYQIDYRICALFLLHKLKNPLQHIRETHFFSLCLIANSKKKEPSKSIKCIQSFEFHLVPSICPSNPNLCTIWKNIANTSLQESSFSKISHFLTIRNSMYQ